MKRAPNRLLRAVLLGLLVTGCRDMSTALSDYCRETGHCEQHGGSFCLPEGEKCAPGDCCGRLLCSQGTCAKSDHPALSFQPDTYDFGGVSVGATATQAFTLRNGGTLATDPIHVQVTGPLGFSVVAAS